MITHTLAVKTGQYEKDGKTKNRWKYIGHVHKGEYGAYITLLASENLAAFPRKEGDDRVMVSIFDKDGDKPKAAPNPPQEQADKEFNDDIPF